MKISTYSVICSALLMATSAFALPKASEIYPKLGIGYNIGNTMEVPKNPTEWGNIIPNEAIIKGIKDAGFGTVRIPCAWNSHTTNGEISEEWLATVKSLVDLCIKQGLYVMLNSHWDEGWLEDHVFDGQGYDKTGLVKSSAADVAALQQKYWTQIANYFKDYDEHLMFASANEPGVNDPWSYAVTEKVGDFDTDGGQWAFDATRMKVLKSFHEACIKGVRSTGGNNATRTIIVQMPRTEIDKYQLLANDYPTDEAGDGYTMAEAHFYPYQLTLMTQDDTWGGPFYYWEDVTTGDTKRTCSGTSLGSKKSIDSQFDKLKTAFTSKGIPVVIGEMGSIKRLDVLEGDNLKKHLESRAAWYGYTVKSAKEHGIVPVVWDTGDEGPGNFTIIRRQAKYGNNLGAVVDVEVMNAMREAFGEAKIEGNTIDDAVKESVSTDDKALLISYATKTADTSEAGTMRIDFSGADWTQYNAISFDMKVVGESAGPCTDKTHDGCGEYGWASVSLFNMSGSWKWKEVSLGNVADLGTFKNIKVEFGDGEGQLAFEQQKNVVSIGLNVYGTQFSGNMYLDNMLLWKADGTADTLNNFNKKMPNELSGTATGKLIAASATGEWSAADAAAKIATVYRAAQALELNVFQGGVQATFNASRSGKATAMLMNGLGQVIAKQEIYATSGANSITLHTDFHGQTFLVVKQGKNKFIQTVKLR